MDWLMDDQMMMQREEVGNDEEDLSARRSEGGKLQVQKVLRAPELVVAHTPKRKRGRKKEQKKKADWSIKRAGGERKQAAL